jgi:tRNA A-37 threonylcarbamoyl transferase component Bud32
MDPTPYAERRLGAILRGKWTLERLLGVGGMAAVYVGVHKIGQRAAIKILHPDVARSPELRARFEQEAHAVNRFKHPGAVEIRDIDVTEDGAPFLVMELLVGASLAELAGRDGGVAVGEVLRLVDELLDVLGAAHAQGIVHRDIKPDNLFVREDGRLKVLDFGIARMREGALRTRAGAMLGTTPYMAPEQIKGVEIDARVDVFAVGATMFRLLAGRRVHEAESEPALLIMMATQPAPPLLSVAPGVPPAVARIVDRALAFDREARYPDALTMQREVRAARTGEVSPAAPPQAVTRVEAAKAPAQPPAATQAALVAAPADPEVEPATEPMVSVVVVRPRPTAVHAGPLDRTVAAPFPAGASPPATSAWHGLDETKIAILAALACLLLVVLALALSLLLRPAPPADETGLDPSPSAAAPDPSASPDDPPVRDPPGRDPGARRPPDGPPPGPPGPPGRGRGHGHGHGKGR